MKFGKDFKITIYKLGKELKTGRFVVATIFFAAWWPLKRPADKVVFAYIKEYTEISENIEDFMILGGCTKL